MRPIRAACSLLALALTPGWSAALAALPAAVFELIAHGRYLDRYEKREGVWRILYRKIIYDWSEVRPYDKELFAKISRGSTKASPDENDPLYTELKLFKRGAR